MQSSPAYRVSRTDGDVGVGKAIVENGADPRPDGPDAAAEDHAGVASLCGYANEKNGYTSRGDGTTRNAARRRCRCARMGAPGTRIDRRDVDADRRSTDVGRVPEFQNRDPTSAVVECSDAAAMPHDAAAVRVTAIGEETAVFHTIASAVRRACGCRRVPSRSAAVATADIMSPIRQTPEKKLTQGAKPSVCKSRSQSRRPKAAADPSETPRSPQGEAMGIILAVERPRCGGAGRAVTNAIL